MNTREGKNKIKNVNRRQKKEAVKPAKYTAIWCPVNARGKGSCLRPECPKGKGTKKNDNNKSFSGRRTRRHAKLLFTSG